MRHQETVLYQENDGIALLTLNRPQALNALNVEMLQRLFGVLDQAQANDSVKALVITGAGDVAFSAGADIKFLNQATPLAVRSFAQMAIAVNHKIETLGKVVIAALNGYTFGGGLEMAEACMIRVAARPAKLGHAEVCIGAIAGFGGTTRLARLVGRGRAAELLLRGRTITADEALQIGLVQSVVDPGDLLAEAETMIGDIVAHCCAIDLGGPSPRPQYDAGRIGLARCGLLWPDCVDGRLPHRHQSIH